MKIKFESVLPDLRIHTSIDEFLIASKGYRILKSHDFGKTWIECGKLPVPINKLILSKSRIFTRALRFGIHLIRQIQNDKILIFCDNSVFLSDYSFSWFKKIHLDSLFFQVLRNSVCVTPEFTYFGEYNMNIKKNQVNIFRTRDGENWEIIYTFPKKSVKHIHLIQFDPFSQKIWFSTGDENSECLLGYANSDFSEMVIVGKNSQDWRCLELLFTSEKVYWGMDNPQGQNWLYSFDRKTYSLQKIAQFNGPVYALKRFSDGYLVLTTNEGGRGEWDDRASLWYSPDIEKLPWKECISFEKDWLPFIFGFGRLLYGCEFNNSLYLSGLALKNCDNVTFVFPSKNLKSRWRDIPLGIKKAVRKKKVIVVRGRGIDPAVNKMADCLAQNGYYVNLLVWDRQRTEKADPLSEFTLTRFTFRAPYDNLIVILYLPIWWIYEFIYLLKNDCDIIHACDIDTIIPAVLAKIVKKVNLNYTIYDFFADLLPHRTPGIIRKFIAFFEKSMIRFTDIVILVDETRYAQIKGAKINKIAYVYNTPPDHYKIIQNPGHFSTLKTFILFYAGSLNKDRGLEYILEAIKDLANVQLIIAGFGSELELISDYIKKDPDKIQYLGLLSYNEVINKTLTSDLLFAFYDPSIPNNRYASPNKLFEAMMSGKPIITNSGTSMAEIVRREGCGIVVPYGDISAITQAILTLKGDPEFCKRMGANGRKTYEQKYSWAIMEKRILAAYDKLQN